MLLLWILFVFYVSYLSCCSVCSLQPCGHLLRKGQPLCSLVCDVFLCFCHFPMWCPGSGVVLGCIDSWSLYSTLLCLHYCNSEHIFSTLKLQTRAGFTYMYIRFRQFVRILFSRNFAKIKPSRKFPNLQYFGATYLYTHQQHITPTNSIYTTISRILSFCSNHVCGKPNDRICDDLHQNFGF